MSSLPPDDERRIRQIAERTPNFGFLLEHDHELVLLGAQAESYVYTDPNAAMYKARLFSELLTRLLVRLTNCRVDGDRQIDRINALKHTGVLVPQVHEWFEAVRHLGNRAAHKHYRRARAALAAVENCFHLADWLHRALTQDRTHRVFLAPQPGTAGPVPTSDAEQHELDKLRATLAEYEDKLAQAREHFDGKADRLERERVARERAERELQRARRDSEELREFVTAQADELEQLRAGFTHPSFAKASPAKRDAFIEHAQRAARPPMNEAQVRAEIDRLLTQAGWQVQDFNMMNLTAAQGVAVREVSMAEGRADYLLYVDHRLVGVIEAKREGADLTAAQKQAARYAAKLTVNQKVSAWRSPLPFQYVCDGNETRFINELDPDARSRRVFAVHQPQTLARWIAEAQEYEQAPTLRARLRQLSHTYLENESLRPAQERSIKGLEESLAKDNPRALIQMATGAGKTYTVVAESYRLIRHARAKRVLFLVDRNNLGKQAYTEFSQYEPPDDGRKFTELYGVDRLSGAQMFDSSKVVISTIQRLWMALTGHDVPDPDTDDSDLDRYDLIDGPAEVSYNPDLPPEAFDFIVVDECHRSIYGKWRAVLEYFDAHLIGLTATPVAQTFGFFHQNLVSEYTYEQAVADGVNVDFDVFRIRTDLGERGGSIPAETVVPVKDRRTRQQRYRELEKDHDYTAADLGKSVIAEDQIRTVLNTFRDNLFTHVFPPEGNGKQGGSRSVVPKTLIFARDDNHAEDIVRIARQVFGLGDDFCVKITHAAKNTDQLIQAFRNSPDLRIAVTVDMIATGTDVRPLECVFFMRDVKSWAYFEQMKGRGARTIDRTEFQAVTPDAVAKTRFVIVDAVGVTDSPRVDARPLMRSKEKQVSLKRLMDKAATMALTEDETATLAGRLSRLACELSPEEQEQVEQAAGRPLRDIVNGLVRAADIDEQEKATQRYGEDGPQRMIREACTPLAANPELRNLLVDIRRKHDIVYDEVSRDQVIEATGISSEELVTRRVSSFREWMQANQEQIAPFELAFREGGEPREVYRNLKALAAAIARPRYNWTPEGLYNAYVELGKAAEQPGSTRGVADLIGILRFELGLDQEVRPYKSLVEERFSAWLARQEQAGAVFTEEQGWWLHRIVDVVSTSVAFGAEHLDESPFLERGGVDGFVGVFGEDRAEALLNELERELSA
ncbi:DEAD/DEAH box helicase family protein [Nocardiopsis sp. NPDC006938]|uniref:DEAD/DEAH box helicase family protein n=1 Tax=Nocardiopsis sp. NPDC006938 TaxID=3364337 RepID=UPI0036823D60